ncbi:hypothetical protein T440DRAFT_16615 [Plenodomus tracheiphilus IPT5]|uniref:F-box domain-containing protein n=1 Tax=Plenodomus tracheiphilus IPT5 TaxID=1408161 RepID=A0A6A7BQG5_9PLEO|nr:hypothetical protein T440DRAFT_16615 [Plenodomus tracheiphilus IPT5]
MTTTTSRLLLPYLPPELRNEVYSYLSKHDANSTTSMAQFLPSPLKHYECKHTSVKITPVHYGCTSLLALQEHHFLEGHEYYTWLKNNALEIQISIVFRHRVNTFAQADWNRKIESHLRKLLKQHEWLSKVARYDVLIHWEPSDGMLRSRKKKATGQIPRDMVKTLTMLMDEKVKREHGCVKVKLLLAHRIAVEHVLHGTKFGLGWFAMALSDDDIKEVVTEAWKTQHLVVTRHGVLGSISALVPEKIGKISASKNGYGREIAVGAGHLLMKKTFRANEVVGAVWGDAQIEGSSGPDPILFQMIEDCLGK